MMGLPVDSKKHVQAGVGIAVALLTGTIERMRLGSGSWTPVIVSAIAAGGVAAFLFGALMAADPFATRSAPSTPEEAAQRRQRARNIAIGLALAGLVVLFYLATIVRLGGNVAKRAL